MGEVANYFLQVDSGEGIENLLLKVRAFGHVSAYQMVYLRKFCRYVSWFLTSVSAFIF